MMCLKDILLYVVLLPIPSASPLFIVLYWLAVFLSIRPCSYCIALFFVVYLATSPSSPFLTITSPLSSIDPARPLTSTPRDRSWLTWNEGPWWDPAIMGYREIAAIYRPRNDTLAADGRAADLAMSDAAERKVALTTDENVPADGVAKTWWRHLPWRQSAVTTIIAPDPTAVAHPAASSSFSPDSMTPPNELADQSNPEVPRLPAKHIDLRWKGLGFVLDFGFARTEEGLSWEIAEHKRALDLPDRLGVRTRSKLPRGAGWRIDVDGERTLYDHPRDPDLTEQPERRHPAGSDEDSESSEREVSRDRKGGVWPYMSFLGSW